MQVDIKEAAHRLGKSEKTLRRWAHEGKIPYHPDDTGRLMFAVSDIEMRQVAPSDRQRIEALEYYITELETRIGTLERLYELEHQKPTRLRKAAPRPAQPQKQAHKGDSLPAGWVPVVDIMREHNVPETTMRRHMQPYFKRGNWKANDGRTIKLALDQAGIAEFMRQFVTQE